MSHSHLHPHPSTHPVRNAALFVIIAAVLLLLLHMALLPGAAGAAAVVSLRATPALFSPNGDKVKDVVKARVKLTRRARLRVAVYDAGGRQVRVLRSWRTLSAGTRTFTWTGLRLGKQCASGRYTIKARAVIRRKTSTARRVVTLDVLAPRVSLSTRGQALLFAGAAAGETFDYAVEGPAPRRLELRLYEATDAGGMGALVATQPVLPPAAAGTLTWDGTGTAGGLLTGRYIARIVAFDAAGNTASSRPLDLALFAPVEVRGTVKTNLGAPAVGAVVTVEGTDLSATTGSSGTFEFRDCPMGFRVFSATHTSLPAGSARVKVNMNTGSADIVMGVTAAPSTTPAAPALSRPSDPRRVNNNVTISGRLYYQDDDAIDQPMRDVRVVIEDRVRTLIGPDWYTDFATISTDDTGFFTYTYNYKDRWDEWDYPDLRVLVYAQDGADDLCAVYDGYWETSPYQWDASGDYTDNASDRYVFSTNTGSDPVCWSMIDTMRRAHDRWKELTGFDAWRVWVDYPVDLGAAGAQLQIDTVYTCINVDPDGAWNTRYLYHEYGHYEQYCAYDWPGTSLGDCNVYWARNSIEGSFVTSEGTYYGPIKGARKVEWTDFKEGWAEFFAAFMWGSDQGGHFKRLEAPHDADPNAGESHVTRALWDLYDDKDTPLADCWDKGTSEDPVAIPRFVGAYGSGDDDRLSQSGSGPSGGAITKLWPVFDYDWPIGMGDVRADLIKRYDKTSFNQRGFDAALYENGLLRGDIGENLYQPSDIHMTGDTRTDGSYRGVVRVWCDVTDPDVYSGDPDQSHIAVRLEYKYSAPVTGHVTWIPVAYTTAKASSAPPGETDHGRWYAVDWDTTLPSPIVMTPSHRGDWDPNMYRQQSCLKGVREDDVELRLIARDDLKETAAVAVALPGGALPDIDNREPAPAQADDDTDYLWWSTGYDEPEATYEFWFKPAASQYGVLAACSWQYNTYAGGVTSRSPSMRISQVDDGLVFALNEGDGATPDGGTWYTVGGGSLVMGQWNHIAAQHGDQGMKLFLNGVLVDSWWDCTIGPTPNELAGPATNGAFSLGDYASKLPQYTTALGRFKWLRVSDYQRYWSDFTPPATYTTDALTQILDSLVEGTNGTSQGFIWVL